jgi:hypothetical protein
MKTENHQILGKGIFGPLGKSIDSQGIWIPAHRKLCTQKVFKCLLWIEFLCDRPRSALALLPGKGSKYQAFDC